MNIHNIEAALKSLARRIDASESVSKAHKKTIFAFRDECYSHGLSDTRVLFYLGKLKMLATRWSNKSLTKMQKDDIKRVVRRIERSQYSEWTKRGFKITIKKFFQWLGGYEWNSGDYPDSVKWIRTSGGKQSRKLPEQMITKEDMERLLKEASSVRDKAMISVLYESGCRVGELLTLKIKSVAFDDYGAVIKVSGGKGSRRVRLVSSVPHLSNWMNHHPIKDDNEAFVWISLGSRNHGRRLGYQCLRQKLRELAKRAGIRQAVNPHNFRHSRATHLASKLTEAQMSEYFGWVQGSDMPSTYVHLSGRDVDNAILRIHGRLPKDQSSAQEELRTKDCPRCYQENAPEADFCGRCRLPLNEKAAMEVEERKKEFLRLVTPEMVERMIDQKVGEILKSKGLQDAAT